ncbi:MAG: 5-formyltetrahydrofolate cyclo-ligase [Candidatus Sumerlaeota bacterium]|nr:5-formyltetrahydrofolate cyclo-ligase [Candidatus Sumerlaeota bacterium]
MSIKDHLRRMARIRRKEMTADECATASARIQEHLLARLASYPDMRIIMSYVSQDTEVDTHALIRRWLREGRRICVPKTDPATRTMKAVAIKDFDRDLAPTAMGILEPLDALASAPNILSPQDIHLHIVPGLCFDRLGRRLGRGAGYYDRFLTQASPQALRVGLAFAWQIVDEVPAESWDARMDWVATEDGIFALDFPAGRRAF